MLLSLIVPELCLLFFFVMLAYLEFAKKSRVRTKSSKQENYMKIVLLFNSSMTAAGNGFSLGPRLVFVEVLGFPSSSLLVPSSLPS